MTNFTYKSNYPHKELPKLSEAEKSQVRLETEELRKIADERKSAYQNSQIAKGLKERYIARKIATPFKLATTFKSATALKSATAFKPATHHRRSNSVPHYAHKNNITKKHKSADDLMKDKVANDISRDQRAKRKVRNKRESILDRIEKMPLDVQEEIYSWIQDSPKNPHKSRPKISKTEVALYPDQFLIEELMQNTKLLDSLIYERAYDVEWNATTYHSCMFDDNDDELAAREAYYETTSIYHKNKLFSTTFEGFKNKTRIEYNVTGDFIRFRVVPKYIKKLDSKYALDYDGLIVVNRQEQEDLTDEEEFLESHQMFQNFSDRVQYIIKNYFSNIQWRYVYSQRRFILDSNGQKYSLIHLDYLPDLKIIS
jgi:hypothetical protein